MSIFKSVNNLGNKNIDDQVLTNRSIDDFNIMNYKNGISNIDYDSMPQPNIYDKLNMMNNYNDDKSFNNSSKYVIDEFYSYRNKLLHTDNMGINRFYKLQKDPMTNVIETYNGIHISRIGMDTTQLYKDSCN